MIRDQPVKLENGAWRFRLGPYEVQTFRVIRAPRGRSGIRAAAVKLLESERKAADSIIGSQLDEARCVSGRAHGRAADLDKLPGWNRLAAVDSLIRDAAEQGAAENTGAAYDRVCSGALKQACALSLH